MKVSRPRPWSFSDLETWVSARCGRPRHGGANCPCTRTGGGGTDIPRRLIGDLGACYTNIDLCADLGISLRQLYRLRASGLTDVEADHLAVRLGVTPWAIWPDWAAGAPPPISKPNNRRKQHDHHQHQTEDHHG